MNISKRLENIEKAFMPTSIAEDEKLQIIIGCSVRGEFIPNNPNDTIEKRKADLKKKYGTNNGVIFINLIDSFM